MTFLLILGSSLAGGLLAVLLAGTVLAVRPSLTELALPRLISFSTGALLGAVLGYLFLSEMRAAGPYLLAFAAAGFLYVALADLVPAQRGGTGLHLAALDLLLLVAGIGVIASVVPVMDLIRR